MWKHCTCCWNGVGEVVSSGVEDFTEVRSTIDCKCTTFLPQRSLSGTKLERFIRCS